MTRFFFATLLSVWFSLSFVNAGQAQKRNQPFFFIQMSDTQFGFYSDNQDFSRETVNFEKAIAQANRLKPAFVIVTGDLTHKVGDKNQIAEYKRISAQLDASIPLYNVPGNHDVEGNPSDAHLSDYKANFGPYYYTFTHKRMLGIVLNSQLFSAKPKAPQAAEAQEKWLKETLERTKRKKYTSIIVFQHQSWFVNSGDEPDEYFNIPMEIRQRYLALFKAYGIKQIFAGHLHRNAYGKSDALEMITTGPVGKPLGW
jgi:3',5'-cyclic AMP phosphodiesterase CpdA